MSESTEHISEIGAYFAINGTFIEGKEIELFATFSSGSMRMSSRIPTR